MNSISQVEETIFSAALLRAPAERAAYLDQACGGDHGLRQRVEDLLKAQPRLGTFMEAPLDGVGDDSKEALRLVPEEGPGTRIGRYKVLQKLGEGGCGVVYMAEQEEPVRRRVALKVIKLGMDTKSVIARFEAERQTLAMMDHPSIAKVLDAGATETGRPYFVMELVKGKKITEFCDQNRLSTRERLDLFIQVCQAVQHAHQKGIIHRDLKPSNILVTVHDPSVPGVPVVIDFGIAKATQGRLTDHTLFTAFEQFLGTPAYMSPEQALMTVLDVDTRSDIYSLGVLLYELLTGHTPFDAKELLAAGLEEMRRTIREKVPLRPSTRLSTLHAAEQVTAASIRQADLPKLVNLVRGDLDWIVMKCLEKDRARRYETANALAMDLQRHLKNEAVLARPPSRIYEIQKTVRRHRIGFAAAGGVMAALALGVVFTSLEAVRADRNADLVQRNSYVADMNLASRAIEEGDLGTARARLRTYVPAPWAKDLRNWEWRYLARQSEGQPRIELAAHSSEVTAVRFLDNDTLLTAGAADWRIILWNWKQRERLITITNSNFGGGVGILALGPNRKALWYRVRYGLAPFLMLADLTTGTDSNFAEVSAAVRSISLSPDEQVLAVASGRRVEFWDTNRRTRLPNSITIEGSGGGQAVFAPDGGSVAVADAAGNLNFWQFPACQRIGQIAHAIPPGDINPDHNALTFSPDGRWLVRPCSDQRTRVWRTSDRCLAQELTNATRMIQGVFSPDGRWLALIGGAGGQDPAVHIWDTATWRKEFVLRGHTDPVTAVDFSPDSQWLATGARNGEVNLWRVDDAVTVQGPLELAPSLYIRPADDGSGFGRIPQPDLAKGVSLPLTAELWTTTPLQRALTVPLVAGPPRSGLVLAGCRGLVLGGYDGSIRVVGPAVGTEIVLSNAHKGEVYLTDSSLDGSTLATKALDEEQVRIWRLPHLERIAGLSHAKHVHSVKLSDDGKLLAAFTGPGDMGVWKIPSLEGPPMWRAFAPLQIPTACAFSADNRFLAAAIPNGELFIWELSTRKRIALPRTLTSYCSVAFSPDGSRLAATSAQEAKMFDTATGQEVLSFKQPGLQLAFTRDGQRLLAINSQAAFVLDAPPFAQLQYAWLKEKPAQKALPYLGPNPDYERPDRP